MIPEIHNLLMFTLAALAILLFPGPAVALITARTMSGGVVAGWVATLGVSLGGLIHVVAASLGLSALLLSSGELFVAIKLLGAVYLVYLGIDRLLRHGSGFSQAAAPEPRPSARVFVEGVLVNALNPKIALFFLAFLPQFVSPGSGSPARQVFALGVLYVLLGLVTDGAYASLAGGLRKLAARRPGILRMERYVTGSALIGLGLYAAASDRPDR
jgi:threonine/homoserine/homoserine lactone efflux protein